MLVNARLAPDMLPFIKQIQIASDNAKFGVARLAGVDAPKFEDNETTLDELRARIKRRSTSSVGSGERVRRRRGSRHQDRRAESHLRDERPLTYLRGWVLPNLFFHVTAAYRDPAPQRSGRWQSATSWASLK